jgi:hypothetical protein
VLRTGEERSQNVLGFNHWNNRTLSARYPKTQMTKLVKAKAIRTLYTVISDIIGHSEIKGNFWNSTVKPKLTAVVILVVSALLTEAQPTPSSLGHVAPQTSIPGNPAPALVLPTAKPQLERPITNASSSQALLPLASTLQREIQLTDTGAKATWGRAKAFFPPDLSAPILVITPDGRNVSFRPTFLVLENRATQETVLLGTVTNSSIGTIYLPNSVIWTNIFDSGPRVSLEIIYDGVKGLIEQNLLVNEALPALPTGWSAADTVLECWTEWTGSEPTGIQSRTVALRPDPGTNTPVLAQDDTVSLGAARITAGGSAFSLGNDSETLPVAKSWVQAPAQNPQQPPRRFLIEVLDLLSASQQLNALPKPARQASLRAPKPGRSQMLQASVADDVRRLTNSTSHSSRRMLVAGTSPRSLQPQLSAFNHQLANPAFVIDFTLLNAVPVSPNAISWWPAGSNPYDALTNHNDGTEYNGLVYSAGEVGQGFSLDGLAAHVRVPDSPSLRVSNAVTVEVWVNPTNSLYYSDILSKWDLVENINQRSFKVSLAPGGQAYFTLSTNGQDSGASFVLTTNSVPTNAWTHIAATYDGSALLVYLNGQTNASGTAANHIFRSTNDLGIGGYVGGADPRDVASPFPGAIDEATIYSRALSASEIQAIYNAGPAGKINPDCAPCPSNAVAWWPGDANAFDIAHTNMGVLLNNARLASGIVGQGFSFNGTGAHVRVPDNQDFHCTDVMTLEAWVYPTDTANIHDIIGKWDYVYGAGQKSFDFSINSEGLVYILVSSDGFDSGNAYIMTDDPIPANAWTHLAAVYDGSSLYLYTNGVVAQQGDYSSGIYPGTNDLAVGGFCGGAQYGQVMSVFSGIIDEPTIYHRALSDTEISAIYSAGCAGKCKVFPGGDLFTDLQRSFLGLSQTNFDADGDGVTDGLEFYQGRRLHAAGAVADTNNVINLQIYTPLK